MAGAGKITAISLLGPRLRDLGYRLHLTAEPTYSALGELIRRETDLYRAETFACLVAADRYHHLETEIEPRLLKGEIVTCDRYIASSYVLQQLDGVPLAFIEALNSLVRQPDLTVLLVTNSAIAVARVTMRGAHDRFQGGISTSKAEAELYRTSASFLSRLGTPVVLTIETTRQRPQQVVEKIIERIVELSQGSCSHPGTNRTATATSAAISSTSPPTSPPRPCHEHRRTLSRRSGRNRHRNY